MGTVALQRTPFYSAHLLLGNTLGDGGALAIAVALESSPPHLRSLDLHGALPRISPQSMLIVCSERNHSRGRPSDRQEPASKYSPHSLGHVECATQNGWLKFLTHIDLADNQLGECADMLVEVVKKNTTLTWLVLDCATSHFAPCMLTEARRLCNEPRRCPEAAACNERQRNPRAAVAAGHRRWPHATHQDTGALTAAALGERLKEVGAHTIHLHCTCDTLL